MSNCPNVHGVHVNKFLKGDDYLQLPVDPYSWFIQNIVPVGGVVNLYGRPKSGKTMLAMDMAISIGDPAIDKWFDYPVCRHGKVLYLQVDTPRPIQYLRFVTAKQFGHNVNAFKLADSLGAPYPFNILEQASYDWLSSQCAQELADVVFIDTLRDIHDENENDSTTMKRVFNRLKLACHHCAMVILTHSKKIGNTNTGAEMNLDMMFEARGTNYVSAHVDTIMRLTKDRLDIHGRMIEEVSHRVQMRKDQGYWIYKLGDLLTAHDEDIKFVELLLNDPRYQGLPKKDKIIYLQEATGRKSFDAARKQFERLVREVGGGELETIDTPEGRLAAAAQRILIGKPIIVGTVPNDVDVE